MSFIQNLRIGTKLAITSLLTIALVALMIVLQMDGGAEVQKLSNGASEQQAIAQNAAEAKASVRGMQIGIRDILTSASPAEMQKAVTYFNDRQTAALKFSGEMARLSRSPDNQKRIERLTTLIGGFQKGEQQIEDAGLCLPGRAQLRHQLGRVGGVTHARHVGAQAREAVPVLEALQGQQLGVAALPQLHVAHAAEAHPREALLALASPARDRAHGAGAAAEQRQHPVRLAVVDGAQQDRRSREDRHRLSLAAGDGRQRKNGGERSRLRRRP